MAEYAARSTVTLVITRPHPPSQTMCDQVAAYGWHLQWLPLLEIRYRDDGDVQRAVRQLSQYSHLVVTSANALRALAGAAAAAGVELSNGAPVCVTVGAASRRAAEELGLCVTSPPTGRTSEDLLHWLTTEARLRPGDNVLWPCGQLADDRFAEGLTGAGCKVTKLICYDTVEAPFDVDVWVQGLEGSALPVVALYSPSAVHAFHRHLGQTGQLFGHMRIAVVGPTTAAAAAAVDLAVWCVAERPTDAAMVAAIAQQLQAEDMSRP